MPCLLQETKTSHNSLQALKELLGITQDVGNNSVQRTGTATLGDRLQVLIYTFRIIG